jgi:hypothetical protein
VTEQALQRAVEQYLGTRRDLWFTRVNPGDRMIVVGSQKRRIRGAPAGTADILGCASGGRFFGIELKSPSGRLTDSQLRWRAQIEAIGGAVVTARAVAEVRAFIDTIVGKESA